MKILSIEEKSKRYDEALDEAKAIHKAIRKDLKPVIEQIFPELKETEDERIRKALITFFQRFPYDNPENAGNLENAGTNAKEVLAWLEKQGEQTSVDKIEPKFHEGDWVVTDKGDTVQIGTVNNDYYTIGNGMLFSMPYVDTSWHLWTIKDAKDGDVLAVDWYQGDDSWEKIIIFKKYHNKGVEGLIHTPCVEGYGNTFKNGKMAFDEEVPYYSKTWTANLHPATKEQRDILFQKMKEEGYVWNEDKKELIKL